MFERYTRATKILFLYLFAMIASTALIGCDSNNVRFSSAAKKDLSKPAGAVDAITAATGYIAKDAFYDVNHQLNSTFKFSVDIATLNGFKGQKKVHWTFLGQTGTAGVVTQGRRAEKDFMFITVGNSDQGTVSARYSVTAGTQTTTATITFNVLCTNCTTTPPPPSPLQAVSTTMQISHNYNQTASQTIDVKTLSGVGADSNVNVSITSVTGNMNGGKAEVINNRISYTTGIFQNNNEDIIINYLLTRNSESSSAQVSVDVTCLPDCVTPTAQSVSVNVVIPTTGPVATSIPLSIAGGNIFITQSPTQGTATISGNSIIYTPFTNALASDTILYRVDKMLNGSILASSAIATIGITIEKQCVDYCDGRPTSVDLTLQPPTRNTNGSLIPEGTLVSYSVASEKQDATEQALVGTIMHTGPLSQTQGGKINIDYSRFSNSSAMKGICFRVNAKNNQNAESAYTNPVCKTW